MLKQNGIYAIGYFDSEKNVKLYPDTHLFVLNNVVKAVYAMTVFAGKLNDDNICLVHLGSIDVDLNLDTSYSSSIVVTFDDVIDYLSTLQEDDFISSGISYKSFLNHYNIIISHINTFRSSLIVPKKGDSNE